MPELVDGGLADGDGGAVDEGGPGVAGDEDEGHGGEDGRQPDEQAGLEHGAPAGRALGQRAARHPVPLHADGQDRHGRRVAHHVLQEGDQLACNTTCGNGE